MALKIEIDQIGDKRRPQAPYFVSAGSPLTILGWGADVGRGSMPAIVARIDDCIEIECTRDFRPGVGRFLGNEAFADAGFVLILDAPLLAGTHRVALGTRTDGAFTPARTLDVCVVAGPEHGPAGPRIIVASSPKSGSSYTRNVLAKYYGTLAPPIAGIFQEWEHNLDAWLTTRLRDRAFVVDLHLRPYEQNVKVMQEFDFVPVVTWRNLGDTIVSFDDHLRREPGQNFLHMELADKTAFVAMPDQDRYAELIRAMTPWYVNFYIGWRRQRPPIFMHYEWLAVDPVGYFRSIIERVTGSVDDSRLDEVLGRRASYSEDFFNVGVNGRSDHKMSNQTKALLEEMLRAPFHENIDELIAELPWNDGPAAILPHGSLAGQHIG